MNKKIEQLLDLALSSPMVIDHPEIKQRLIEDARQLDYLTVNNEATVELIDNMRKLKGQIINIDLLYEVNYMAGSSLAEIFAHIDFESLTAKAIIEVAKLRENKN